MIIYDKFDNLVYGKNIYDNKWQIGLFIQMEWVQIIKYIR